jgi:hypothetical protein
MDFKRRLLFMNLDTRARQNLILFALAVFYLFQSGLMLSASGLSIVTSDYLGFWSIGHIANTQGYSAVYDLDVLRETQLLLMKSKDPVNFVTTPAPLLPVFVILFQAMAYLPPSWSFILWTGVNLLTLVLYLRYFLRSIIPSERVPRILFIVIMSFPVFWNLLWGQANVWLLVCVGEFLRSLIKKKPFRAGMWLGGLLLKPQALVLLGIALLFQRVWKVFAGFLSTSSVILIASFLMAGLEGFSNLLSLWIGYAEGIPSNAPEKMVNWRMIGIRLTSISTPILGWGIAFIGIVVSIWFVASLWRSSLFSSTPRSMIVLLGSLSATMILTWHSHIHMEMIIIPPLIYLYAKEYLPESILNSWLLIPVVSLMVGLLIFSLLTPLELGIPISEVSIIFISFSIFVLNIYLLVWCDKKIRSIP